MPPMPRVAAASATRDEPASDRVLSNTLMASPGVNERDSVPSGISRAHGGTLPNPAERVKLAERVKDEWNLRNERVAWDRKISDALCCGS